MPHWRLENKRRPDGKGTSKTKCHISKLISRLTLITGFMRIATLGKTVPVGSGDTGQVNLVTASCVFLISDIFFKRLLQWGSGKGGGNIPSNKSDAHPFNHSKQSRV